MKTALLLLGILRLSVVRPQNFQPPHIIRYNFDNNNNYEGYSFDVETSDGFKHQQVGELLNPGAQNEALAVRGSYSYIGSDGALYTVIYTADENGFQPEGAHIPRTTGVKKLGLKPHVLTSLVGGNNR